MNVVFVPKSRHQEQACIEAKLAELEKLKQFGTYHVVEDRGQPVVSTKWVLTSKGDRIKARLVARGFEEDFLFQTDSPTVSKCSMRVFLAISSSFQWNIKSTDIKSAFLQGQTLERDVFITPPVEAEVQEGHIWKLDRCLYGLSDGARQFYLSVRGELLNLGCTQSSLDPALFYLRDSQEGLQGIICCHIDDFLHAGNTFFDNIVVKFTERFIAGKVEAKEFCYVGFHISQVPGGIILDQQAYVDELEVEGLGAQSVGQGDTPLTVKDQRTLRRIVGKINWTVQGSRPDMAFEMVELSTKLQAGCVTDFRRAVKVVCRIKEQNAHVFFPNLGSPISWKIVVFSDAALANLSDGVSSMGAHLVFLVGEGDKCCPCCS